MIDGKVLGTVRLTPFPLNPILNSTNGRAEIPFDENTISVSKGFMIPEYRQNGIFSLVFSSALLFCKNKSLIKVVGAYEHNVRSKDFTRRLGFEEIDQLIEVGVPPYHKTFIIPIVCDLEKRYSSYLNEHKLARQQVIEAGFDVEIEIDELIKKHT